MATEADNSGQTSPPPAYEAESVEPASRQTVAENVANTLNYQPGKQLQMILLGKTGCGKSSLGNALLGRDEFQTGTGFFHSVTCRSSSVTVLTGCRFLTVIDTPGVMDTRREMLHEVCNAITYCPGGFHAFVIAIRLDMRFTTEEHESVQLLMRMFGENFHKFAVYVFTHADSIGNDENRFRQGLEESKAAFPFFNELLERSNNRVIMIDNSRNCDRQLRERQLSRLVEIVDNLSPQGEKYTNFYFVEVQRIMAVQEDREEVAQELAQQVEEDGRSCFPADSQVFDPDGRPLPIQELKVGQSVLCCHKGQLVSSPVFMWGHRDVSTSSVSYVTVRTESRSLTLSSDHHLVVGDGSRTLSARNMKVGQELLVLSDTCRNLITEQVVSVQHQVLRTGLFAPFTLRGTVVVDGVLASCYVDCVPPAVSHRLLRPVRMAWRASPRLTESVNSLGEDGMAAWVSGVTGGILPALTKVKRLVRKWRGGPEEHDTPH